MANRRYTPRAQDAPEQSDTVMVDAELTAGAGRDPRLADPAAGSAPVGISPSLLAYGVGPVALVMLLLLRACGLVSAVPAWAYIVAIVGAQISGRIVERWDAPRGSWRLHVRVATHVAAVTSVIYLSGWGPALGMAFAFSAFADLQQSGAAAWRAALGWSLTGCVVGQTLIAVDVMPSFLSTRQAQTIGALGAFVFAIAIRMAGAVGERNERIERELAKTNADVAVARDEAQRSAAHYRAVVDNAAEGIITVGGDGRIQSFNGSAESMFGWTAADIVGNPVATLVPVELHEHLQAFLGSCTTDGDSAARRQGTEIMAVRRDGTPFPVMIAISSIAGDDGRPTLSAVMRDLSEQKRFEAELAYQGLHDALTGLPNRVTLTDRLDQARARLRRNGGMFAVLFIDLDRFKPVNDRLGHSVGDQLLTLAGQRIKASVREVDTVARLGGDEFVVLLEDATALNHVTMVADRILSALRKPFRLGDEEARIDASIGIAHCASPDEDAETILAHADIAMYRAKQQGRGQFALFDEAMQEWITNQNALEAALRQAIPNKELVLHYQPVVRAGTGRVQGFEALLRWNRPGLGLVPPDRFIPIAESTDMIIDIGKWVVNVACLQAAAWNRRWRDEDYGVSVNISGRQLAHGDLVEVVASALAYSSLEPRLLTLEITETVLISDPIAANETLRELTDLGVNIALDDFGTGYSSLTYLRSLPINVVKIDKSFVGALGTGHEDTAIVTAVIGLARDLRITVVAEGVETPSQLAMLSELQCPYVQGYLFSAAVPEDHIPELIEGPAFAMPRSA